MKTEKQVRAFLNQVEGNITAQVLDDPNLSDDIKEAVYLMAAWSDALRWTLGLPNAIDESLFAGDN